jgi:hypothetical protein
MIQNIRTLVAQARLLQQGAPMLSDAFFCLRS